jgi:hypothetical protein
MEVVLRPGLAPELLGRREPARRASAADGPINSVSARKLQASELKTLRDGARLTKRCRESVSSRLPRVLSDQQTDFIQPGELFGETLP